MKLNIVLWFFGSFYVLVLLNSFGETVFLCFIFVVVVLTFIILIKRLYIFRTAPSLIDSANGFPNLLYCVTDPLDGVCPRQL